MYQLCFKMEENYQANILLINLQIVCRQKPCAKSAFIGPI